MRYIASEKPRGGSFGRTRFLRALCFPATRSGVLASGIIATLLLGCSVSTVQTASSPAPSSQVVITGMDQVRMGSSVQLAAAVGGNGDSAVTWAVNGMAGGAAGTGTISANGAYTPPISIPPAGGAVTITATADTSTASSAATRTESILSPLPVLATATASSGSGSNSYSFDVTGTGLMASSQLAVNGALVTTSSASATELTATATVDPSLSVVLVAVVNPDPGGSSSAATAVTLHPTSATAAARFLDQVTFGPTLADINHVQQVGMVNYLGEQVAAAYTPFTVTPADPAACAPNAFTCFQSQWWQAAVTGSDQLRERMAFALSEIFVVSKYGVSAQALMTYHNTLAADAFGNFAALLKDVTLSPAMGAYLNMLNSAKPGATTIANENYARETMQLFTIGLPLLESDGAADPSHASTYTEAQVQAFARVFTGWTYANADGSPPNRYPNWTINSDLPMVAVESAHDTSAKDLLLGTTLAAGQTAEQDLDQALSNILNHPNVGPFVCRQLIQHLVISAPSPAYVGRVAAVFANNGLGVRGDMQAVAKAILLDPEARQADTDASFDSAHLREPVLYMASVMRALGVQNTVVNGYSPNAGNYSAELGEMPFEAPSVFNFFPPDYVIPGTTLNAPEFGEENTATAILRINLAENLLFNFIHGYAVDLSATSTLGTLASQSGDALEDSGKLVDALSVLFLHGQMPAAMRQAIVTHVSTLAEIERRVRVAVYLVITSPQYKVMQ